MFPSIVAIDARICKFSIITLRKKGPFSGPALLSRENESIGRTTPLDLTVGITDTNNRLKFKST